MNQQRIMALLQEAVMAGFERRNQIATELSAESAMRQNRPGIGSAEDGVQALAQMLYVQCIMERAELLPYPFPVFAAVFGDREDVGYVVHPDLALYRFFLHDEHATAVRRADYQREKLERRHQSRHSGRDDE